VGFADGIPGPVRSAKLFYATAMRVPGHKAHSSQIAEMCRAFSGIGVDTTLLVADRRTYGRDSVDQFYGFDRPIARERLADIDFMTLLPRAAPRRFHSLAHRVFVASFHQSLIRRLKQEDDDFLVFTRDPSTARTALKTVSPERVCLELHMLAPADDPSRLREQADTVNSLGGCIVVTRGMREMLAVAGVAAQQVLVKPNAIDLRAFPGSIDAGEARRQLLLPTDKRIVMFIGNMTAVQTGRGLDTLFKAASRLRAEGENLLVCLVGAENDEADGLRRVAGECGLDMQDLHVAARQPYESLSLWMSAGDILVHPLPEHHIYNRITSPLKLFQYRTAARPIVASDLPSIREILVDREDCLLARPGDSADLAARLHELLHDPDLAAELSRNSRRKAEAWTWEHRAGDITSWMEARSGLSLRGRAGAAVSA